MSGDELKQLLDTVKLSLIANKTVVTPNLLNDLKEFVNELRGQPASTPHEAWAKVQSKRPAGVVGDINIDGILAGISQALDVEARMIGDQGSLIIKILNALQERTILLAIAARLINI